jgi:dihydropteroate synthase
MGILNVTPDSFSDGGRFLDVDAAVAHGRHLIDEGADVLDIGGESTRPGAVAVSADLELARVLPVIEALAPLGVRLSIDTTKPAVARAAVAAGATLINDVSAGLEGLAAELRVGWIAMHRRGDPATMQLDPHYDDVVAEVCQELAAAAARGRAAGVTEIWLDPGLGFGKTASHNMALLAHLDRVVALGHPVCVGASRKRFLGESLARSDGARPGPDGRIEPVAADDRREGSLAAATMAMAQGAAMVRVHDVRMTVHAARVVAAPV